MIRVDRQDYRDKSKDEILDDLEDALNELDRVKRELRKYKGPNTPPSAYQHLKTGMAMVPRGHKRGASIRHLGSNRPWLPDALSRHIVAKECPRCHSDDIRVHRTGRQQITNVPREILPETTNVERDYCECNKCHLKFVAHDEQMPLKGRFGIDLMVLIIIIRGVMRKTTGF